MNDHQFDTFLEYIERDWTWRIRDLVSFKQVLSFTPKESKITICRLGVILLYSHWEGFIKNASKHFLKLFKNTDITSLPKPILETYLNYIITQNQKKLNNVEVSKICVSKLSKGNIISNKIEDIINTKSNLDSNNFKLLLKEIGMNEKDFEMKYKYIDYTFLPVRHGIAHGEQRPVTEEEFLEFEYEIIQLIEKFKKNIIDLAVEASELAKHPNEHQCLEFE